MTVKTIKTQNGKTIKVEMVREVKDETVWLDGDTDTRTIYVDETTITLSDENGKMIAQAHELGKVYPQFDSKAIAGGAVAKLGSVYLRLDMYNLISGLVTEVEAETPKTEMQIKAEAIKAENIADYNSSEQVEYREFMRQMDSPDSDY